MLNYKKLGFTLIELMIVVAIIGILAAIAIPKFADLIKKSQEGATRGRLGAVRGSIQVYYADNEGAYPTGLLPEAMVPKYIKEIPVCKLPDTGHSETASILQVLVQDIPNVYSGGFTMATWDAGMWSYCEYQSGVSGMGMQANIVRHWGDFWVSCTHSDIKGTYWSHH